jgi:hypothetical protein
VERILSAGASLRAAGPSTATTRGFTTFAAYLGHMVSVLADSLPALACDLTLPVRAHSRETARTPACTAAAAAAFLGLSVHFLKHLVLLLVLCWVSNK